MASSHRILLVEDDVLIGMMLVRPQGLLGSREIWWTRKRTPSLTPRAEPT